MRIAFFVLLFANAAYFAWANWIDAPIVARASANEELPRLQLASEQGTGTAGLESADTLVPTAAQPPARCVSVGPFQDLVTAARAAATLQERGMQTRQRAEEGADWTGYWVYVNVKNPQDQTRALRRLERGGIADAHAMPESETSRRISLGLFSERARADRRARAVARLGMTPELVERTQTGAAYWIDFDLSARDSAIAAEGLLSSNATGSRIEIRACPTPIERPMLANSPG